MVSRALVVAMFALAIRSEATMASEGMGKLAEQLKHLVEINSGTGNVNGVGRIQRWIESELQGLGFSVELRPDRLLVATRSGGEGLKVVTVLVHADTVFEPSSPFQKFTVKDDGKVAVGPGVVDDKGGIVVALEGIRRFMKSSAVASSSPKISLRLVSSPTEETGSAGLTDTFRALSRDSWMVLSFEPAMDDGSLIESRRGNRWYHITVTGKESHAGRAHREGINACHALAQALSDLSRLTRYEKDVTVSIARMEGGKDKFNIVCGEAQAKVDTRFSTIRGRDELHDKFERILKKQYLPGAKARYELADDCPPFSPSKEGTAQLKSYLSLVESIEGRKIRSRHSGGASDSNYFSRAGTIVLDGLGPVGGKFHTTDEFVELASLETRAEAFHRFLLGLK